MVSACIATLYWYFKHSGTYYQKGGKDRVTRESTRSNQAMVYTKRADSIAIGNKQATDVETDGIGYASVIPIKQPTEPKAEPARGNFTDLSGVTEALQTSV